MSDKMRAAAERLLNEVSITEDPYCGLALDIKLVATGALTWIDADAEKAMLVEGLFDSHAKSESQYAEIASLRAEVERLRGDVTLYREHGESGWSRAEALAQEVMALKERLRKAGYPDGE